MLMFASTKKAGFHLVCLLCVCLVSLTSVYAQSRQSTGASCALTPDQILGQAFSGTAGAEGETSENGLTPEGEPIEQEGLAADAEWLMANLLYTSSGPEQVAILVIDDFSSDGSGDAPASHGWLVWQVFEQLYIHLPQEATDLITLQQVNIADEVGYRSDLILPAIESALEQLASEGIDRFVFNMSFVFVPCVSKDLDFDFADFKAARQRDSDHSLVEHVGGDADYVHSILDDARVGYIDETGLASLEQETPRGSAHLTAREETDLNEIPPTPSHSVPSFRSRDLSVLQLFNNTQLQSDPLRAYLRGLRDIIIVPVASAGNFKQRQPFYPARWPEVISISANEGNDLRFWLHSNNGDISVPGAWFLFDDGQYRAGTSFAAPVASILIAIDLTQTDPTCEIRGNAPMLARGSYDNELFVEAAKQYCGR
jgi:hypothetical protein